MTENTDFPIAQAETFTPFWRRFPSFFIYPMQAGTLMRLAIYSVFGGLSLSISGVFGAGMHFAVWALFLRYALMVMGRTANGQFDEPDGWDEKAEGGLAQIIRQLALLGIMGLFAALLGSKFGGIGSGLGWLITSLLTPAGIMIISTNRSLIQALHPAQIFLFIKTVGSPYLSLCFIVLSMTESGDWMQFFLTKHMHSWLLFPLFSFAGFYFSLITYHMMGYVIYQYHGELGLNATVDFGRAQAKIAPKKAVDPVIAQLGPLMAEGHYGTAIDLLREELRKRWENNDLHDRYQKLLVAAGKNTLAANHAREFIVKLVNEKRMFQALDLCEKWLKIDPGFTLNDSYHVYELASAANLANRKKLALDLMRDFDKKYPDHPHIPQLYLLMAQILHEHFQKNDEAMKILQALQTGYPGHPLGVKADQYIKTMGRLAETPAGA